MSVLESIQGNLNRPTSHPCQSSNYSSVPESKASIVLLEPLPQQLICQEVGAESGNVPCKGDKRSPEIGTRYGLNYQWKYGKVYLKTPFAPSSEMMCLKQSTCPENLPGCICNFESLERFHGQCFVLTCRSTFTLSRGATRKGATTTWENIPPKRIWDWDGILIFLYYTQTWVVDSWSAFEFAPASRRPQQLAYLQWHGLDSMFVCEWCWPE